jgi:hypothetical protein
MSEWRNFLPYFNSSSFFIRPIDSGDKSIMNQRLMKFHKLVTKMTTSNSRPRPTCKQILKEKHLWALSLLDLEKVENVKQILEEKDI